MEGPDVTCEDNDVVKGIERDKYEDDNNGSNLVSHELLIIDNENKICEVVSVDMVEFENCGKEEMDAQMSYCCEVCGKMFVNQPLLDEHQRAVCLVKNEGDLVDDTNTDTSVLSIKIEDNSEMDCSSVNLNCQCSICEDIFACENDLKTHVKVHHSETCVIINTPTACPLCNVVLVSADVVKNHKCSPTVKKEHQCPVCQKQFTRLTAMKGHVKTHVKRKNVASAGGGKIKRDDEIVISSSHNDFDLDKQSLANETESGHYLDQSWQCPNCGGTFSCKADLQAHSKGQLCESKIIADTSLKCPLCKVIMSSLEQFKAHSCSRPISDAKKERQCPICKKQFKKINAMKGHMRTHGKNERPSPVDDDKMHNGEIGQQDTEGDSFGDLENQLDTDKSLKQSLQCPSCEDNLPTMEHLQKHVTEQHSDSITASSLSSCPLCNAVFTSSDIENTHVCSHSVGDSRKKHKCPVCKRQFKLLNAMKGHMRTHAQKKRVKKGKATDTIQHLCSLCGQDFATSENLREHVMTHSERPHKCSECSASYILEKHLKAHIKGHSGSKQHVCPVCNQNFEHAKDLREHGREHVTNATCVCQICGKMFGTKASLRKHMLCHSGKKHKCPDCEASYVRPQMLKIHMRIHTGERPYWCSNCSKTFFTWGALDNHLKFAKCEDLSKAGEKEDDTNEEESSGGQNSGCHSKRRSKKPRPIKEKKSIPCTECDKVFKNRSLLKDHMNTHTGEKPYPCHHCGKTFGSANNMKAHLKVHSSERPHVCPECGASYKAKKVLKAHLRTHTGERPYMCKVCCATFNTSSVLSKHAKTHTRNYAFKCSLCDSRFIDRATLARHTRVHTGEKPYKCEMCPSSHSTQSALKIHMRTHTGEKPYGCPLCEKAFIAYSCLKNHLLNRHGKLLRIVK